MERKEARDKRDEVLESAQYSDASNEIQQLQNVFNMIEAMKVKKNAKSAYIDPSLLTDKDLTIGMIKKIITDEGSLVMTTTAKKVLDRFWRYFTTEDAET